MYKHIWDTRWGADWKPNLKNTKPCLQNQTGDELVWVPLWSVKISQYQTVPYRRGIGGEEELPSNRKNNVAEPKWGAGGLVGGGVGQKKAELKNEGIKPN